MDHLSLRNEVADKIKLVCNKVGSLKDALENLHLGDFFYLLCTGICVSIACELLGGGIPAQNSSYRGTRLCPSIVLSCY